MSEERPGDDSPRIDEGATPGSVGALDGAAAAGSAGAVGEPIDPDGAEERQAVVPTKAPDPGVGPD